MRLFSKILSVGIATERLPPVADDPAVQARAAAVDAGLAAQVRERTRTVFGRALAIPRSGRRFVQRLRDRDYRADRPGLRPERFGIHFVASPRHADLLLVTGPVTRNMEVPLRKTYEATPEPKLVVASAIAPRPAACSRERLRRRGQRAGRDTGGRRGAGLSAGRRPTSSVAFSRPRPARRGPPMTPAALDAVFWLTLRGLRLVAVRGRGSGREPARRPAPCGCGGRHRRAGRLWLAGRVLTRRPVRLDDPRPYLPRPVACRSSLIALGAVFLAISPLVAVPVAVYGTLYTRRSTGATRRGGRRRMFGPFLLAHEPGGPGRECSDVPARLGTDDGRVGFPGHYRARAAESIERRPLVRRHGAPGLGLLPLSSCSAAADAAHVRRGSAASAAGPRRRRTRNVVFLLALVGFGSKAGLVPLHVWLPRAHPAAPSHVSALMSGVMIKLGVYGLVRIVLDLLGGGPTWWGVVILAAGASTALTRRPLRAGGARFEAPAGVFDRREHRDHLRSALARASCSTVSTSRRSPRSRSPPGCCTSSTMPRSRACSSSAPAPCCTRPATRNIERPRRPDQTDAVDGGRVSRGSALSICRAAALQRLRQRMAALPVASCRVSRAHARRLPSCSRSGSARWPSPAASPPRRFVKAFGITFLAMPRSPEAGRAHEAGWPMRAGMGILAVACASAGRAVDSPADRRRRRRRQPRPPACAFRRGLELAGVRNAAGDGAHVAPRHRGGARRGCCRRRTGDRLAPPGAASTTPGGADALCRRRAWSTPATAFAEPLRRIFGELYRPTEDLSVDVHAELAYHISGITYRTAVHPWFERGLYEPAAAGDRARGRARAAAAVRLASTRTWRTSSSCS